jgi:hypothetical protein
MLALVEDIYSWKQLSIYSKKLPGLDSLILWASCKKGLFRLRFVFAFEVNCCKYYKYELGEPCSTIGKDKRNTIFWSENNTGRVHMGNIGKGRIIILKWIFENSVWKCEIDSNG